FDRADLRGAEAAVALLAAALQLRRAEVAVGDIHDHSVGASVETIALLQESVEDGLAVGGGERLRQDWQSVFVAGRGLVELYGAVFDTKIGMSGAHGRRADNDTVEQLGIALRGEHAFASAGRAAGHVAVADIASVIELGHSLAIDRHRADRSLREVERGALVGHETVVEAGAFVTTVMA